MDLEKIKDIVRSAREMAKTDEGQDLIDHFEAFVDLLGQRESAEKDPHFLQKLTSMHNQFWTCFQKVAASSGLTQDMIKQHVENTENFTPAQWGQIQTIHKEAASQGGVSEEKSASSLPPQKRLRKNSKKMRI